MEDSELQAAIQKCIKALDKKFRTALVLVDVEGLDYATAAEVAGVPIGTIKAA